MKNSIILLLGLVLLFAIPALASTPENENAPAMTNEDQQFIGLTTISEEELIEIYGNAEAINGSGTVVYNPNTGNLINTSNGKVFKVLDPNKVFANLVKAGVDPYTATAITLAIVQINHSLSDLFVMD